MAAYVQGEMTTRALTQAGRLERFAPEKAKSLDPETIVKTCEGLTQPGYLQTTLGPAYILGVKTLCVNRVTCAPYAISRATNGRLTNVKYIMHARMSAALGLDDLAPIFQRELFRLFHFPFNKAWIAICRFRI
jgi:hypothetical protein